MKHKLTWISTTVFIAISSILTYYAVSYILVQQQVNRDKAIVWNEITFPDGNVGTIRPPEVEAGNNVILTYKTYCNFGVNVTISNWVDIYDAKDNTTIVRSYFLNTIQSYNTKPGCISPYIQLVNIPQDLNFSVNSTSKIRLRSIYTYEKPEQTIKVETYSEQFILEKIKFASKT